MPDIFIYGTLQSPEIVKKLTGKSFKTFSAVLPGYKRYCVKEGDYPAVIHQNDAETIGLVLKNVDDLSLEIISFYEGDEYEKRQVAVNMKGKPTDVLIFVWVNGIEFLENKDWDLNDFEQTFLENYLDVIIPETRDLFYLK